MSKKTIKYNVSITIVISIIFLIFHLFQITILQNIFDQNSSIIWLEYFILLFLICMFFSSLSTIGTLRWIFTIVLYVAINGFMYWLMISYFYTIYSPLQLLYLLEFIQYLNIKFLFLFLFLFLCHLGWGFVFYRYGRYLKPYSLSTWVSVFFNIIVVFSIYLLIIISSAGVSQIEFRSIFIELYHLEQVKNPQPSELKLWPHRTAADVAGIKSLSHDKILYVLVESWGVPINQSELNMQLQPLYKNSFVKNIQLDSVKFSVGTMAAEIRELCGVYSDFLQSKDIWEKLDGEKCIPNVFIKKGFEVKGLHGGPEAMYNRDIWYPHIGLKNRYFYQAPLNEMKNCYSFEGWCDQNWFPHIKNWLSQHDSVFIYWLTLNSHYPYDERDFQILHSSQQDDCEKMTQERCIYQRLQQQFFWGLSDMVNQYRMSSPNGKPVKVILVGDHRPAFTNNGDRLKYLQQEVPVMVFEF